MKTGHLFLSNTTKIRLNITERFHFPMVLKSSRWSVLTLSLGVAFPFFHAVDFAHAAETDVKKEKTHHSSPVDKATKKRVISVKTVTDQQHDQTESVIVTGTRSANRGARDSISPITVISSAQLQRTGETNLADALVRSDPSINMTAHGSDASALTSAIRMRGLSANEVLVLINGKRRHTTANMGSDVGPEYGTTPVDLNMIPANAIDHIEVLEDGAAAMYGSDAIAGVINIITKKQDHGLNLSGQTGANAYNGDGWQYQLNADGGLKLGNDGYIHISGQMYHTDHYIKRIASNQLVPVPEGSKLRVGANQYLSPGQTQYTGAYGQVSPYSDQRESTPEETRENLSIDWEKPISGATSFYGLITYAHRHAESIQHYRYPGAAGLETLEMYPSGFSPVETINENDYAATLGVKGKHLFGFDWDVSTTYGADEDQIYTENSLNVGLLRSTCSTDPSALTYSSIGCGYSPRKARAETFRAAQWTNTADFRRRFNIAHTVPMTLAMGAEHRLETYQIDAGDPAAYEAGGFTGYSGLRPGNAGNWSRDIWAGYLDGDFRLTRNWELDFAGRFEHYTDVGNTENGKVSTRYNITKRIALRGTISTGFRAPSLAEENFSALNQSATGATAFLPTSSAVSRSLGASQLKPERSTNVSGGIVLEPVTGFHIEADVYQINLRDRIGIGGSLTNDDNGGPNSIAVANAIESLGGIYTASGQYSASYLANDASTRTQGVDIKADYQFRMRQYGNLLLSMGIDLNRTRLHHNGISANGTQYLNAQNIALLTQSYPRSKIILNAYYTVGHWDVNIRQTRFGQTTSLLTQQAMVTSATTCPYNSNTCFNKFVNSPLWVTDLEVGYRFNKKWHLAVGANNIFNVRPRRVNPANNYLGTNIYDDNSATVPFYGAYYYGRVNATF